MQTVERETSETPFSQTDVIEAKQLIKTTDMQLYDPRTLIFEGDPSYTSPYMLSVATQKQGVANALVDLFTKAGGSVEDRSIFCNYPNRTADYFSVTADREVFQVAKSQIEGPSRTY